MKKVVFLASGAGGNLAFLHAALESSQPQNLKVVGVIVDRKCGALDLANKLSIPAVEISYDGKDSSSLIAALDKFQPDYIITNIHRILDEGFVTRYLGRMINLHYSLLPAFGGVIGVKPIKQALEAGCKFVGTTVHYVSEKVDAGPIIAQSIVPVIENEPFENLMDRVFRSGCTNLLGALNLLAGKKEDQPREFSPEFWKKIKEGS